MKKTIKDLEKAGLGAVGWFKAGVYYLFVPIVVIAGLRSVNWRALFASEPQM
jgi:thiamine monophosphate synthase